MSLPSTRRIRSRRHGYVLIVTLGVLTLATAALVSVARIAIQRSVDARAAQEELQRRWGTISARRAILPFVEEILSSAEAQQRKATPLLRVPIRLGNQMFHLVLADEQAKANVNAMIDQLSVARAQGRLEQQLSFMAGAVKLRVEPIAEDLRQRHKQPSTTQSTATTVTTTRASVAIIAANDRPVSGYGQIFGRNTILANRLVTPSRGDASAPPAVDLLTCWGSGAINIRRASRASLQLATSLTPIEISRLLSARDALLQGRSIANPQQAAGGGVATRLLAAAQLAQTSLKESAPLTDTSACQSLWIIVDDSHREWFSFSVIDHTDSDHPRTDSFTW